MSRAAFLIIVANYLNLDRYSCCLQTTQCDTKEGRFRKEIYIYKQKKIKAIKKSNHKDKDNKKMEEEEREMKTLKGKRTENKK